MAHLKKSILIHAPVEKVYALARDPHRWATWYVGLSLSSTVLYEAQLATTGSNVGGLGR